MKEPQSSPSGDYCWGSADATAMSTASFMLAEKDSEGMYQVTLEDGTKAMCIPRETKRLNARRLEVRAPRGKASPVAKRRLYCGWGLPVCGMYIFTINSAVLYRAIWLVESSKF